MATGKPTEGRTDPATGADAALWASTVAFTACFAVWTIFSIIGLSIKDELGLTETEFGLLIGTPILTGSLSRIFLGVWSDWSDQFGGRRIFCGRDGAGGGGHLPDLLRPQVHALGGCTGRRAGRRLVLGRRCICIEILSAGPAGHGAGHFRRRKRRRSGHQVRRAVRHGRLRLGGGRADLGGGSGRARHPVPARHQGGPRATEPSARGAQSRVDRLADRGAAQPAGLALLALLLLRLRWLRRAGALAASLHERCLRSRRGVGWHAGGVLFGAGQPLPHLWRAALGPLWRARSCTGPWASRRSAFSC